MVDGWQQQAECGSRVPGTLSLQKHSQQHSRMFLGYVIREIVVFQEILSRRIGYINTYTCRLVIRNFLESFWVCGDRSVFVKSHRPAHTSRAHVFSLIELCISHLKCFLFAWPCVSISDYAVTRIYSGYALTGYCLQFDQVFLFCFTLASSGPPGIIGQHQQPHWLVLRRSRNEPFSFTAHGARPSSRGCVSRTS